MTALNVTVVWGNRNSDKKENATEINNTNSDEVIARLLLGQHYKERTKLIKQENDEARSIFP